MYQKVRWPENQAPAVSALYALNDIDVRTPPETVWDLLVDAENWATYFPPEDQVTITSGGPKLGLGTTFTRVTVGFPMTLTVTECEPMQRLSWSTVVDEAPDSTAYHGWVITPTNGGCHVLTEETQQGDFFLEELGHKRPGALYSYHQDWVERLASAAETRARRAR